MRRPLRCTYRLQLNPELDFHQALELVLLGVAPVRDWAGAVPEGLRGLWPRALTDAARELGETVAVSELLVAPYGVGLLERG